MIKNDWSPRPPRAESPSCGSSYSDDDYPIRWFRGPHEDAHNRARIASMSQNRMWDKKFVWPRDKGRGGGLSRLKNVCTGKGPDVFISKGKSHGPHRSEWSGWQRERTHGNPETLIDNRGHTFLREPILQPRWAHRDPDKHYDFKSRTHRSPRPDHWQDVERDPRDNRRPLYTKFGNGREWVADELCGGLGELYNRGLAPNPLKMIHLGDRWFGFRGVNNCEICLGNDWEYMAQRRQMEWERRERERRAQDFI